MLTRAGTPVTHTNRENQYVEPAAIPTQPSAPDAPSSVKKEAKKQKKYMKILLYVIFGIFAVLLIMYVVGEYRNKKRYSSVQGI